MVRGSQGSDEFRKICETIGFRTMAIVTTYPQRLQEQQEINSLLRQALSQQEQISEELRQLLRMERDMAAAAQMDAQVGVTAPGLLPVRRMKKMGKMGVKKKSYFLRNTTVMNRVALIIKQNGR